MSQAFDVDTVHSRAHLHNNGVETNLTRFYLYLVFIIIFDLILINTSLLSLSRYICVSLFRFVESVR